MCIHILSCVLTPERPCVVPVLCVVDATPLSVMASAAADTPGRSIELTDVTVSGPISGGLSAQDGNQEAVLGSPLRATAELVKGDASAVGPTHTGGHADPAEKHEPEVQAGVVWTVFNFLNSIVGGACWCHPCASAYPRPAPPAPHSFHCRYA